MQGIPAASAGSSCDLQPAPGISACRDRDTGWLGQGEHQALTCLLVQPWAGASPSNGPEAHFRECHMPAYLQWYLMPGQPDDFYKHWEIGALWFSLWSFSCRLKRGCFTLNLVSDQQKRSFIQTRSKALCCDFNQIEIKPLLRIKKWAWTAVGSFYLVKTGFSWDDQTQWQAGVASALPDGKCLSLAPKPTDTSGLWAAPGPQQQISCVPQWPAPIASQEPFYHIDLLSQEDSWVRSYGFEQPGVGGVLFPSCWQGAHCP